MITSETIGISLQGREIRLVSNIDRHNVHPQPLTLIIGGMHGNERAPVPMLENFITRYLASGKIVEPVCVLPLLNPDGYYANSRTNARGVDLNRNFPCHWSRESIDPSGEAPLSEPESIALYDFILTVKPMKVINLHWSLSEIDADGSQSINLAVKMWHALSEVEKRHYRLKHRIARTGKEVECPGSLGQWCGYNLQYSNNQTPAMITLELPYTTDSTRVLHPLPVDSFATVCRLWEEHASEYLQRIEPGVHTMLQVACISDV